MDSTMSTTPTMPPEPQVIAAPPAQGSSDPLEIAEYPFTADQFTRMIEADIFPRESRVELWDGVVYDKMAKHRAHSISGTMMSYAFMRVLPEGWYAGQEESLELDQRKVPLPDVMIVRGKPTDYPNAFPTARDIGLVVELSLSSLKSDTGPKLRGYARAGIPQYWVANLVANLLLVHRDPVPDEARYATFETYRHGETVPLYLDGVEVVRVAVSEILPPPRA